LFDGDFIIRLEFEVKKPGERYIYVWAPMKAGQTTGIAQGAAAKILVSAGETTSSSGGFKTGSINLQPPVRRAEIRSDFSNTLKIICSDARCTVYVNDLTLNTLRVNREEVRGIPKFIRKFIPYWGNYLALGLQSGEESIGFKGITVEKVETPVDTGSTQGQVQRGIILPLFLAAFVATFIFGFVHLQPHGAGPIGPGEAGGSSAGHPLSWIESAWKAGWYSAALVFALRVLHKFWVFIAFGLGKIGGYISGLLGPRIRRLFKRFPPRLPPSRRWPVQQDTSPLAQIARETVSIGFAAAIGGLVVRALYGLFVGKDLQAVTVWATPALIVAFLITIVFHIGFLGRAMQDERREWWGRLTAWLLIYVLAWVAIFGVAFYAVPVLHWATSQTRFGVRAVGAGWILSTLSGLIAARSADTGQEKSNKLVELIAKVAPYVFIVGFFFLLSWAVAALLPLIAEAQLPFEKSALWQQLKALAIRFELPGDLWAPSVLAATSGLIALLLSWRLDINQFSMHLLYRNRLGRCYLGASNRLRRAQPFTGFSPNDDFLLSDLADLRFNNGSESVPYPILSAALNLVGGKELAWQQRKAASFTFSPLFCGYDFTELPPGYCPTKIFANRPPPPVSLATAMAISGAAASPNMGYHTSPAPAFLMTVFNVRLGWWLGNPRHKRGYKKSGPLNVILRLTCELFGLTSEEGKYIYLSDGGHFENLGIYELVRRRCRFIVACDAEEDRSFGFGGLGNAIEKCRSDFGIDIDIDVEPIRHRSEKGQSQWHCAIGRISYSRVDPDGRDGILVYLKSSLTGDEPTDALRYATANPEFPHQTTGDQWFDESQFESYRVLGYHIAENVFGALGDATKLRTLTNEELFVQLAEAWYPPSSAPADAFTKHTRTTVKIYDELRTNKHLAFLSQQIYPEWWVLLNSKDPPDTLRPLRDQLPKDDDDLKAGFYLCNSVLQLFEDAYVDLNLEDEYDHPDNRGWMNLFKHWSWAAMLRVTWTICASNYGARFQTFCERHLGLKIGDTSVPPISFGEPVDPTDKSMMDHWGDPGELSESIDEAIWEWLEQLPLGSKTVADAALEATKLAEGSKIDPDNISEQTALVNAKALVTKVLDSKKEQKVQFQPLGRNDAEWFGAATLVELCRRSGVKQTVKDTEAAKVADRVRYYSAVIAGRLAAKDFEKELNPVERDLIRSFFTFNPSLIVSAEIRRLEVTPDPKASRSMPTERNLHFPFGFVILAKTKRPADPEETEPVQRIVYFRVQDHLRRMGLARDALAVMVAESNELEADLRKMHPKAGEVPTDGERARFMRLFDSVKNTTLQKKAVVSSDLD
jgi:hypothetical protein